MSMTVGGIGNLVVVLVIHAVESEVCIVVLVHAECLDGVAGVTPCALHEDGCAHTLMWYLVTHGAM